VFGVKESLLATFKRTDDPARAQEYDFANPFWDVAHDFVLAACPSRTDREEARSVEGEATTDGCLDAGVPRRRCGCGAPFSYVGSGLSPVRRESGGGRARPGSSNISLTASCAQKKFLAAGKQCKFDCVQSPLFQ